MSSTVAAITLEAMTTAITATTPPRRWAGRHVSFFDTAIRSASGGAALHRSRQALDPPWSNAVQRTGINGSSLFAAYGNKKGLFLASLERYRAEVGSRLNVLEHGERGLDDLVAFVSWLSEINSSDHRPLGCLMVNTMVEFGTSEPSIAEQVALYRQQLADSIQATLERASRLGEISETTVAARTHLVRAGLFGALVIANVGSSKEVVDALEAVRHEVESWRDNEASAG